MLKKTVIAALVAVMALGSLATAAERKGEFALGFNTTDAPVGVRYFTGDKTAVDLGLGFESTDLGDESATSFFFEGGFTYVLYDYQSSFFFVRPAVGYQSLDDRDYGTGTADAKWTVLTLGLNLGAEVRLAERFGLTFQHGLRYTSTSLPDEILEEGDPDSYNDFSTFGENVTEAGVWFTF